MSYGHSDYSNIVINFSMCSLVDALL